MEMILLKVMGSAAVASAVVAAALSFRMSRKLAGRFPGRPDTDQPKSGRKFFNL